MAKQLRKGDETRRRFNIMKASRSRDASLLPQLLARLAGDESYENKRHIVRALGHIGGAKVEGTLLRMLENERGLILGEIAHALGRLGTRKAVPALRSLIDHESEWVRQNVSFALQRLSTVK
jgi:HEAT repeat protein